MAIDDPFDWGETATATSQPHAPARPTDSQVEQGYPEGQPVPAEELNWLAYMVGRISRGLGFTALETLVNTLAAGETGLLLEDALGANRPGSAKTAATITGFPIGGGGVAVSGSAVVWWRNDKVVLDNRDLAFATNADEGLYATTVSHATTARIRIVTNGVYVVALYESGGTTYLECFNMTLTKLWEYNLTTADGYDLCLDGTRVYAAHAQNTLFAGVTAVTLATGVIAWDDFAGDAYSICVGGGRVFYTRSGANWIAARRASDGADEATAPFVAWILALGGNAITARGGLLATDGERLYQACDLASLDTITVWSCLNGDRIVGSDFVDPVTAAAEPRQIAIDHEYLYMTMSETGTALGGLYGFRLSDLSPAWAFGAVAADTAGFRSVATDGAAIFTIRDNASGPLCRHYRGNQPTRFTRVTGAADYLTMRQLAVPER